MTTHVTSINLVYRKFAIPLAHLMMLSVIALPLAGCSDDGGGASPISSLSTPTEAPSGMDTPPGGVEGSDSNNLQSELAESSLDNPSSEVAESNLEPPVTSSDGDEDPTISMTHTPTGVTARLTWDASSDPNVTGYYIYYGKQSSGEPGSCSYEESQAVETPPATITGLDPNTPYFFAISAHSESESPCSNEVLMVTPPAQS
jgi:hypothetical protein